jgi:hypothetical protein
MAPLDECHFEPGTRQVPGACNTHDTAAKNQCVHYRLRQTASELDLHDDS